MKLYLDTNIWIDYLDEKRENHRKALRLFDKIQNEKLSIIITSLHADEICRHPNDLLFASKSKELIRQGLCITAEIMGEDIVEAELLDDKIKVGLFDVIHVTVAKRSNAIIVSSDYDWTKISEMNGTVCFGYELFFKYFD